MALIEAHILNETWGEAAGFCHTLENAFQMVGLVHMGNLVNTLCDICRNVYSDEGSSAKKATIMATYLTLKNEAENAYPIIENEIQRMKAFLSQSSGLTSQ